MRSKSNSLFRAAGLTLLAGLLPACGDGGGSTTASTVTLSGLAPSPAVVAPGGAVVLTASASDSAGGTLSYAWSAPSGNLSSPSGNPVTWTAPAAVGSVSLQVTVTSSAGSSTSGVAGVLVATNPGGGSITIDTLAASPSAVAPGGAVTLSASASDSAAGSLTYTWSASAGNLSAPAGTPVTWTAPGAVGSYPIELTVTSSSGASTAAVVGVVVSDNPGGGAISLTSIGASPASVLPSGSVALSASATYSGPGVLTYAWSVPAGSLSSPTGSPVTWTAPTALGSHVATLTVSDGLGATASGAAGILVSPAPGGAIVTSVLPSEARPGDEFVVRGVGFGGSQGARWLTVSGSTAPILAWSASEIRATVPNGAKTGEVRVESAAGPSAPGRLVVLWPWAQPANVPIRRGRDPATLPLAVTDGEGGSIVLWLERGELWVQRTNAAGSAVWGGNGVPVSRKLSGQSNARMSTDGAGGACIVWERFGEGMDLYAQRISAAGAALWKPDGVPVCKAVGNQNKAEVAADGLGGAVVTWVDFRNGAASDLFAQRLDASGSPLWGADGVAVCTAAGNVDVPRPAVDATGKIFVSWSDFRSGTSDVYAQRLDGFGAGLWPSDGVAVCNAALAQVLPALVPDGAGGVLVAWEDGRGGAGQTDVYAQRLNDAGQTQWAANGLPVSAAAALQVEPEVVRDGSGGFFFTWSDTRTAAASARDIYAQRLNGSGAPQWAVDGVVVCAASSNQYDPQLALDGSGGAFIAWTDERGATTDVFAQRLDGSGTPAWTVNGVAVCTAANQQTLTRMVAGASGDVLLAWQDTRTAPTEIFGQRLNAAGAAQWAAQGIPVRKVSGNYVNSTFMIPDGTGGAFTVWSASGGVGASADVFAQRVDGQGKPLWTVDGVPLCTATGPQGSLHAAPDGAGGLLCVWEDSRAGFSDIYAQRVNASGTALWTTDGVPVCTAAGFQSVPRIATDGTGGAVVAWTDRRIEADPEEIYAQRINAAGAPAWTVDGIQVTSDPTRQAYSDLVPDGSGGAILAWTDTRSGEDDLYAQRLNSAGVPQWTPNGIPLCTAGLAQNYLRMKSDGSNGAYCVWLDERSGYEVYAQRVDAAGNPLWAANGLRIGVASDFIDISELAPDVSGGFLAAWSGGPAVTAQRVSATGTRLWGTNGVSVSTQSQTQPPQLASDGWGGAIVTWNVTQEVYAQRISAAGLRVWTTDGVLLGIWGLQIGRLVSDAHGGAIVSWIDGRSAENSIYAQLVSMNGLQ